MVAKINIFLLLKSPRLLRLLQKAVALITSLTTGFLLSHLKASAQSESVSIVRDAEIEALISDYATPILKTAGLSNRNIHIVLVNDKSFNAFVDGRHIYINTGTFLQAETPNEIIGVIAHETGHLAGGHQQRLREQLQHTRIMAAIGTLIGMGASVAGAATGNSTVTQTGAILAMGAPETAIRNFLHYRRSEEVTADRSAITYLEQTKQSANGILTTLARFATALSLTNTRIDPYHITHPMPRERIANLETLVRQSHFFTHKDSETLQLRHDMVRAKIAAYGDGVTSITRIFRNNPHGIGFRYGVAIATFLNDSTKIALSKIDTLIQEQPKNPYFYEMRGEILLKANDLTAAATAFEKATVFDVNKSGLIQTNFGRALMLTGLAKNIPLAIKALQIGIARDPGFPTGYHYLAQAYGQIGNIGKAELATAEMHYYSGNMQAARSFATRAKQKLTSHSPDWIRAQDIININYGKL